MSRQVGSWTRRRMGRDPVWCWCLHCERAQLVRVPEDAEEWVTELCPGVRCAFSDCDGGPFDVSSWDSVLESHLEGRGFPKVPAGHGVLYRQFEHSVRVERFR